jgi:glycine cleavage system aminomethyltransferase T
MAYVPPAFAKAETPIEIEIRGKRYPATVIPKPGARKPIDPPPEQPIDPAVEP